MKLYHMSSTLLPGMETTPDFKNQYELANPFAEALAYSKECFMGMVFSAEYLRAVLGKFGMKDMWSYHLKWATEGAFEYVRKAEFPNCCSRLKCNYFYDNLENVKRLFWEDWRGASDEERKKIRLLEMEMDDPCLQKRDMLLFDEAFDAMAEAKDIECVLRCAREYFSGGQTDKPVWEILSDKPVKATRDISCYIHDEE